jgi:predicted porin
VQTPEGQLLNNLTNLTARQDGSLGSAEDVLGDGSPSSLSSFNLQSQGGFALDQNIARYQTFVLELSEDLERNHFDLSSSYTRRTILSRIFVGPQTTNSWNIAARYARDLTPLMRASLGTAYLLDNEFGGEGRTFSLDGQLSYSLSRQTSIYIGAQYLHRDSSTTFQALSPFTGNLTDVRATIGLSHTL